MRSFRLVYSFVVAFGLVILSCKKEKSNLDNNVSQPPVIVKSGSTVSDIDGNSYKTVKIGSQIWMAENLRVTKYSTGEAILNVKEANAWTNLSTGAFVNYNNSNNTDSIGKFGRLYNWYVVTDSRNVCPDGWHVPTDVEWTALSDFLGGVEVAGGKMKEKDTVHWMSPNSEATDERGFTALPVGVRHYEGTFFDEGKTAKFWSCIMQDNSTAWMRHLYYGNPEVTRAAVDKHYGLSVRCVKD